MCIDIFTSIEYSIRFQQPHYISRKGILSKKGEKNHAKCDEQPIPFMAENRRGYETIIQCIHADIYLWSNH